MFTQSLLKNGILLFLLICQLGSSLFAQKEKLVWAHSHNDYEQKKPLFKALAFDFQSIEIDVIRYGNQLIVSHDSLDLHEKSNIRDLYLAPLSRYLTSSKEKNIWLLIDIKKYDAQVLEILHEVIEGYAHLFKKRDFLENEKPLQILLSGDIPRKEIMENDKYVYFFIDGRLSDLGKGYDATLMPMVSADFSKHTKWVGKGSLDKHDYTQLRNNIMRVHAENKVIRFWNTKDRRKVWRVLLTLGVDFIGVDHLKRFRRFRSK